MSFRSLRLLSACAMFAALCALAAPALAAGNDEPMGSAGSLKVDSGPAWPQFQGGPDHAGYVPDGPEPPYDVAWRYEPEAFGGFSGVVVADGDVFAVSAKKVIAVDLMSGDELWAIDRAEGPVGVPAITVTEKGMVLVYVEGKGRDTMLVAAEAATGKRQWDLELEDDSTTGVTLSGETALVANDVGQVFAVDAQTGEALWTTEEPAGKIATALSVFDEQVVYSAADEVKRILRFVAVDLGSGERAWMTEPDAVGATAFSKADGRLMTAALGFSGGQVLAVDPASGASAWEAGMRGSVSGAGSVAVAGDRAYAVDQAAGVYAFDAATGDRVWDFQENGTAQVSGAPVVSGGYVVTGLQNGTAIGVDTQTGHLAWRSDIADDALRAPAVAGDLIIFGVGGPDGGMVALRHTDGQLLDEVSPTQFDAAAVAKSFVVALVLVPLALWGLGRVAGPWLWSRGDGARADDEAEGEMNAEEDE